MACVRSCYPRLCSWLAAGQIWAGWQPQHSARNLEQGMLPGEARGQGKLRCHSLLLTTSTGCCDLRHWLHAPVSVLQKNPTADSRLGCGLMWIWQPRKWKSFRTCCIPELLMRKLSGEAPQAAGKEEQVKPCCLTEDMLVEWA